MLGADHADTLLAAYNLADCLSSQGTHAEAEDLLQEVLEAEQRTKGPGHADPLQTAATLAEAKAAAREATIAQRRAPASRPAPRLPPMRTLICFNLIALTPWKCRCF